MKVQSNEIKAIEIPTSLVVKTKPVTSENNTNTNSSVEYSYDDDIKMFIAKVTNEKTSEVKQIPTEDMVRTMRAIDRMVGNIIDEKV